jgi:hypothetical protein
MTKWSPFGTAPKDGREILVLRRQWTFPELEVVRSDGSKWRHRGSTPRNWFAPDIIAGDGAAWWAPVDAIPGRGEDPRGRWYPAESAPRDGSPFWWVHWIHYVGVGIEPYDRPRISLLRRHRDAWCGEVRTVSEHEASEGFWTRDALPLSPDYQLAERLAEEAKQEARRVAKGQIGPSPARPVLEAPSGARR